MRRITFAVATALILGALTLALPKLRSNVQADSIANPIAIQLGSDACKNVKFKFTNQRSDKATIRIEQVKYYVASKDAHRTENVHTVNDCKYGSTCVTTGDNLTDSLDRDLSKFQVVYRFLPPTVGANWSDPVQTPELSADNPRCSNNRTYGPGSQGWTIPPK